MLAVFGRIDPAKINTFDNDTSHCLLRTMRDMTTWFCDAYASWQKGGIENAMDAYVDGCRNIDRTPDQDIQEIVLTTNLTRKCLGFLIAELGKDVQIRSS
jgi:transposase, IS30 family